MREGWETPWDSTPIIGISQKLGYVFLRYEERRGWVEYMPRVSPHGYQRNHETLVIHPNDLRFLDLN